MLFARVLGGDSFDEGDPGLFGGGGVVTDAAGDDEELARADEDVATVGLGTADAQFAAEDEEELVLKGVGGGGGLSHAPPDPV